MAATTVRKPRSNWRQPIVSERLKAVTKPSCCSSTYQPLRMVQPQPPKRSRFFMKQRNGHSGKSRADRKGYEQTWYALGLSKDLAPGQIIGRDFLDGKVVIWRGADG